MASTLRPLKTSSGIRRAAALFSSSGIHVLLLRPQHSALYHLDYEGDFQFCKDATFHLLSLISPLRRNRHSVQYEMDHCTPMYEWKTLFGSYFSRRACRRSQ